MVRQTIEEMLEIFDMLDQKIDRLDGELLKIAHNDKDVRLLMTAQGIGPITALTYKAEIFDLSRFSNSRVVEAYLGMTPTQYSSGEMQKQGRI